jgi:RNA polymerase sigma-70 factor (ECF subfamily)
LQKKTTYSEAELVTLLKTKDERAYNHLYDNYSGALYNVIVKVLGNREEAVDVLQESFIKIWKNIAQYDQDKGRLFTWMLQVTRNTAIDFMRSGSTQKENKTNRLEPNSPIIEQKNFTFMPTDHLGLSKVVDGLRAEDKQIVDLAYFQGFTQHEIAEELSIPLGTVKTRARMALIQLRNILKTN